MLSKFNLLTVQELSNGSVGREEEQALRNSFCGFGEPRAAGASQGGVSNTQNILSAPTRAGPLHHCSQWQVGGRRRYLSSPLNTWRSFKLREKPDTPGLRGSLEALPIHLWEFKVGTFLVEAFEAPWLCPWGREWPFPHSLLPLPLGSLQGNELLVGLAQSFRSSQQQNLGVVWQ